MLNAIDLGYFLAENFYSELKRMSEYGVPRIKKRKLLPIMEYDKRELNKYGRKHKERGRHDIDFDKGAVNAPIAVRAIMKLIEYYTSIAKHDSVKALTTKLNRFLKSIGASHRHGGLSGENTPVDPGDPGYPGDPSGEGDFSGR